VLDFPKLEMSPPLLSLARDLVGSGVVVSLAAVPLFFSALLIDPFELAKAATIRGMASLLLPVLCVTFAVGWREIRAELSGLRRWALWLVLAYVGAVALSTVASVSPPLSLWGSPARSQGALTAAAFAVFFAGALVSGTRECWAWRAALALSLTSLPVTLYAVLQWRRLDPLPFRTVPWAGVVPSFLGNPNWIGAWLNRRRR